MLSNLFVVTVGVAAAAAAVRLLMRPGVVVPMPLLLWLWPQSCSGRDRPGWSLRQCFSLRRAPAGHSCRACALATVTLVLSGLSADARRKRFKLPHNLRALRSRGR